MTGPRLLSFADAVAEMAKATGWHIDYLQVTPDEFAAGLAAEGLPVDYVTALTEIFGTVLDGRSSFVTDGLRRALGREPRDFADFARDAAATGVWAPTGGA